jgi:hypothetical protein
MKQCIFDKYQPILENYAVFLKEIINIIFLKIKFQNLKSHFHSVIFFGYLFWLFFVLFTRRQLFCKKIFCKNFMCQKKFFFWRGRNIKTVKIGTNQCKFTRFSVKYMFLPLQIFFLLKNNFFCDRVKIKFLRVNTP